MAECEATVIANAEGAFYQLLPSAAVEDICSLLPPLASPPTTTTTITAATVTRVQMLLTLDRTLVEVQADPDFTTTVKSDVADLLGVQLEAVVVLSISAGSVVVKIRVDNPQRSAASLTGQTVAGVSVLHAAEVETGETVSTVVRAASPQPRPAPAQLKPDAGDGHAVAAVLGIVAATLLGGVALAIWQRRRHMAAEVAPAGKKKMPAHDVRGVGKTLQSTATGSKSGDKRKAMHGI